MIREWKRAQIAEYDSAVEAAGFCESVTFELTDAETAEVIEASEHNTKISLKAHTIQIGGSG
jgi:hypothetical protein